MTSLRSFRVEQEDEFTTLAAEEVDEMMAKLWEDESTRNRRRVAEISNFLLTHLPVIVHCDDSLGW